MAKLTKQQAKQHAIALEILKNEVLTDAQKKCPFEHQLGLFA